MDADIQTGGFVISFRQVAHDLWLAILTRCEATTLPLVTGKNRCCGPEWNDVPAPRLLPSDHTRVLSTRSLASVGPKKRLSRCFKRQSELPSRCWVCRAPERQRLALRANWRRVHTCPNSRWWRLQAHKSARFTFVKNGLRTMENHSRRAVCQPNPWEPWVRNS
jgi:hypothetical protein